MKLTWVIAGATACALSLTAAGARARGQETKDGEGAAPKLPSVAPLEARVRTLVERHFPKASWRASGNEIQFEYKTRTFTLDRPGDKAGKTVVRQKERGPAKHGILCEMELREGKYDGQADVPQTTDYGPFKLWLAAPESKQHNCYLYVHLYYPPDVSKAFLKDFKALVNGFEKDLD